MNPLDWDLGNLPPGLPWGGVDEAGRGAWAGPVVAACAVIDHAAAARWGHVLREARDSKLVAPEKRASLARELKMVLPAWGVAEVDNLTIDRDNILEASLSAMRQAVDACPVKPRILLVDGNRAPRTGLLERLVVDGDAISCAVACASILAKAHRDALMEGLEDVFPGYGFRANKGYGTPAHRKGLAGLGPSPVHRVSFAPVAALQQADEDLLEPLAAAMEACNTLADLQAWVEVRLRPAYGRLRPAWIAGLRSRYAERLAVLAGEDQG
ncbi:MAG TPA: ribonuclease HII [Holophaga sp.]|nr:ribonuclease HII [Holophaga sp.]